jgi:hypothetical protein
MNANGKIPARDFIKELYAEYGVDVDKRFRRKKGLPSNKSKRSKRKGKARRIKRK